MAKQKPRKHHYVPECYLKNFTTDNIVYTLNINNVRNGYNEFPRKKTTAQICYLNDYYKIEREFKNDPQFQGIYDDLYIESSLLNALENKYNTFYSELITSSSIKNIHVIQWCDYIIQMKIRNPYFLQYTIKKNITEWVDSSLEQVIKTLSIDNRYKAIPIEIKKSLAKKIAAQNKNDPDFSKSMMFRSLLNREAYNSDLNETFRHAIINSKWYLLETNTHPYFITSDNPGFSLAQNDNLIYNTRFAGGYSFYFPISPNYCLLVSDFELDNFYIQKKEKKAVPHVNASSELVLLINNHTIKQNNGLLIASDDWYLSKIRELNTPI